MATRIKQYDVWFADLNPRFGTEPGKLRPVVIIQTDLLTETGHPSTIICPLTTNVIPEASILRIHLTKKEAGTTKPSDILVDQLRAIDNQRFVQKLGTLDKTSIKILRENLTIILDL
ncbi:MAG: type II toxin-antitoxin system PemK/MazF family toxin [Bacteroidota bacterium]